MSASGLLKNSNYWMLALPKSALTVTAEDVRDLFEIILTTCSPSIPNRLWEKFSENVNDILHQVRR